MCTPDRRTDCSALDNQAPVSYTHLDVYKRQVERYTYEPAGRMKAKVDKDGYETSFRSGKSEILQTFILGAATLFHPYEIGFLIIDFKGGGMVNQFKDLPHLILSLIHI